MAGGCWSDESLVILRYRDLTTQRFKSQTYVYVDICSLKAGKQHDS
jgi:hypothetical protein